MPEAAAPNDRLASLPWGAETDADPIVTTLRVRSLRGWPKFPEGGAADLIPLSEALATEWSTDRYIAAYMAADLSLLGPRRLNKPALQPDKIQYIGGLVSLLVLIIEVDCPTKGDDPSSVEPWWEGGEQAKVEKLLGDQPGLVAYRTRGGYRILGRLTRAFELRSPADDAQWVTLYQAVLAWLRRCYGIVGDDACIDWTRLQGLPRATREGSAVAEDRWAAGDPDRVGAWDLSGLSESDWAEGDARASARPMRTNITELAAGEGFGDDGEEADEKRLRGLWERLQRAKKPVSKALSGGGRNGDMLVIAMIIFNDWNLPEEQGLEVFRRYNMELCSPPYGEDVLVRLYQNARNYASGNRGSARVDFDVAEGALRATRRPVVGGQPVGGGGGGGASTVTVAPAAAATTTSTSTSTAVEPDPERAVSNVRAKVVVPVTTDIESMSDRAKAILYDDPDERRRLYQRGGKLVQLALDGRAREEQSNEPIGAAIIPVQDICVAARLSTLATWLRTKTWNNKPPTQEPVEPPEKVARRILSSGSWPVRQLMNVAECPTLRPDGSLISRAGFDERSGLFLWPSAELRGIEIPENPTREDALRAYLLLRDVFGEFPFVEECHGAAAVAFVLSVVLRGTYLGPAPIFALKAPQSDAGKSLLADCVSIIALGREAPRYGYVQDDADIRKLITSILSAGKVMSLIDNVVGQFGGPSWDAVLSGRSWEDRPFGQNTAILTLPATTVFAVTGNKLKVKDDMVKRTAPIEIDPAVPKPGEREFKRDDLPGYCRDNRRELVRACLTLGAAYLRAGMPGARKSTGPFRAWSRTIRGMVEWASWIPGVSAPREDGLERGADPWGGQKAFGEEADQTNSDNTSMAEEWYRVFKSEPVTAAVAFAHTDKVLHDAILAAIGDREGDKATQLGNLIGRLQKQTFGSNNQEGYRFERVSMKNKTWRVVRTSRGG